MNDIIKVVIVDDMPLYRYAVETALLNDPQIKILGQGETALEAVDLVKALHPDIIVLDLGLPGGGLNAARELNASIPTTRVIVLTASDADDDRIQATQAGVCAYLLKGVSGRELVQTIHEVWKRGCQNHLFPSFS